MTAFDEVQLTLAHAPTNRANDTNVDSTFTANSDPAILGFRINDGRAQRSRVTRLLVVFSSSLPGLTVSNFQLASFASMLTATQRIQSTRSHFMDQGRNMARCQMGMTP